MAGPVPNQAGQPLPSFVPPTRVQTDPLDDPEFVNSTPEQKHAWFSNIESPGYDPDYAQAPPVLQQKYIQSLSSQPGIFGTAGIPTRMPDGSVLPQNQVQRVLAGWTEPLGKLLLAAASAHAGGRAAGALTSRLPTLVPALGRALGAGTATGATTEGTMGDKLAEGAKGAGWSLGAEGLLRAGAGAGNTLAGSTAGKRFLEGARPGPGKPAVPASNPVTTTNTMVDLGANNIDPAFRTRAILGPQGQTVRTVHSQPVMDELAQQGIPAPLAPGKDLLVSRTNMPGAPAVLESYLERILRSGAPAAAAQDPDVQDIGLMMPGVKIVQKILEKFGLTGGGSNDLGKVSRRIGTGG